MEMGFTTKLGTRFLDYNNDLGVYGVVVSTFDFHRSDRGSNPGRGGKIS